MGTRSLTYFYQNGKPFCAFYRQMDGYPEGHGAELGEILAPLTLVNGYQMGQEAGQFANGAGCLAAQVIAKLKDAHGIGGIYMVAPELNQDSWQEYEYHVHVNINEAEDRNWKAKFETHIEVTDTRNTIFSGSFEEFLKWAQKPKRTEDGDYIPVLKHKASKAKVYKNLRDALQHEVVSVRFTKADDSTRLMKCTTNMEKIPEDKHPAGVQESLRHDPHLFKVFDLDKNDWRAFREERVIDWKVF